MQDLTSRVTQGTALNAGESMAAGNTVSHDPDNVAMSAPGSAPVNPLPSTTDDPKIEIPSPEGPTTVVHPGSSVPVSGTWQKAGK